MTVHPDRLAEIAARSLDAGEHKSVDEGLCIMEAVAYVAGEPWSDHPKCVSPVIAEFLRSWNDGLPSDADRDRLLKPLIPTLIGSAASSDIEALRSYMALDWLVRVQTPKWLDLAGIADHARILRELGSISDRQTCDDAQASIVAARVAARDAAGDAARVAAWAAVRDAAGDAARVAAWAAAGAAAGVVAWAAVRDAARVAAKDALAPTVAHLQVSALDLIGRMLAAEVTA